LERSEQFLSDAEAALEEGRLFTAVDRAYYSMFHAAHAILLLRGFRPPRTHKGLVHMFSLNIEKQGLVKKGLSKMLSEALNARQEGTYTVDAEFTKGEGEKLTGDAKEFLAEVKKSMEGKG